MFMRLLFVLVSLSMVPSEGFCVLIGNVYIPGLEGADVDVVDDTRFGSARSFPIGSLIYAGNYRTDDDELETHRGPALSSSSEGAVYMVNYGFGVIVTSPEVYEAMEGTSFLFRIIEVIIHRERNEENQDPYQHLSYIKDIPQRGTRYNSEDLAALLSNTREAIQDQPWIDNGTHVFRNNDAENVMDKERISRTYESLKVLYDETLDQEGKEGDLFADLQKYLLGLREDSPVFHLLKAALLTVHPPLNGDLFYGNEDEPNYPPLSVNQLYTTFKKAEGLYDVVWMANAAARVWHLVNTLKPENPTEESEQKFRHMLQQDFVKALARCIRPNALSRVCDLGKMQRMLCVLQGYVPGIMIDDVEAPVTSDQFLKGFMVKFEPLLPDILNKETDEQRTFVNTMRTSLTTEFQEAKKDTEEFAVFRNDVEKQFNNFIRLSFDLEDDHD
ncbi:hypothetical protein [Candidatus Nucleicultrix amoebiphila]|uniref:Uncharacterized protein n=1 Tax=Candidatus Nucleicultrix amoebiphila FS5 TaxID=1414854 RepID=A0A1W6N5A1_9PROT|nr:hypothetical protein [Candidatus Nucleicultrix amoebiphila]ARN85033.1 hypothetical protein GQ61_06715 [Candidatus Nucleicultrix amoebiphila FS5]